MKNKFVLLLPFLCAYICSYFLKCCHDFVGYRCFYFVLFDPEFDKIQNILLYLFLNLPHFITVYLLYIYVFAKVIKKYILGLITISILSLLYWPIKLLIEDGIELLRFGYWMWSISQIYFYGLIFFNYRTFTKKNSAG